MPPIPNDAAAVIGILLAIFFALVVVGGIAIAYTYARRAIRKARITQRAEGWGGADHPNQSMEGAEPTPPALETAQSILNLLPGKAADAAKAPEKPAA